MYTIGYIDEDKGWQQTFYDYFKDDFNVINIELSCSSTVQNLVNEVEQKEIELLVVDFRLNETGEVTFNGDEIIENIILKRPYFPIIVLTSFEPDAIGTLENVNIVNGKDILDGENQEKVDLLKKKINATISNYYHKIENAQKIIDEIIEIKNSGIELSLQQEEMLTEKFMFLEKIYPDEKIIPDNLIQHGSITKLNEFVENTKIIIEELKKMK